METVGPSTKSTRKERKKKQALYEPSIVLGWKKYEQVMHHHASSNQDFQGRSQASSCCTWLLSAPLASSPQVTTLPSNNTAVKAKSAPMIAWTSRSWACTLLPRRGTRDLASVSSDLGPGAVSEGEEPRGGELRGFEKGRIISRVLKPVGEGDLLLPKWVM